MATEESTKLGIKWMMNNDITGAKWMMLPTKLVLPYELPKSLLTLLRKCLAGGWGTTAAIEVSSQRGCQFDHEIFGNDPRTNGVPIAGKGKRFWQGW